MCTENTAPPRRTGSRAIWYPMPHTAFGTSVMDQKTVAWVSFPLTEAQLGDDTPGVSHRGSGRGGHERSAHSDTERMGSDFRGSAAGMDCGPAGPAVVMAGFMEFSSGPGRQQGRPQGPHHLGLFGNQHFVIQGFFKQAAHAGVLGHAARKRRGSV